MRYPPLVFTPFYLRTTPQRSNTHHLRKGCDCVVSAGQWLLRRIFSIMPRMKCRCPYSASVMIGHVRSVERLYPFGGKHELQSSLCEASPP